MPKSLNWTDFGLQQNPFPMLTHRVQFSPGADGRRPFEFAYYNPEARVLNKSLSDHLPMAGALWHFGNPLLDIFSSQGTAIAPWDDGTGTYAQAESRLRVFYYFLHRLGIPFWCFHDYDIVPTGSSMAEFHENLDRIMGTVKELTDLTAIEVGWTTQNLFSAPAYTEGAASSPDFDVFAQAWAQTRKMLEIAKWLQDHGCGARNHVFWGGREGYRQLLSTMVSAEKKQLAAFFWMAVRYCEQIGLKIQFLIEPKPAEPSMYQYDRSVEVAMSFLREFGLQDYFKFNVETNHAQLAGLTMDHECMVAAEAGLLGGVDVNEGSPGNGWDTDRFLGDPLIGFGIMYPVLRYDGLGTGVFNFDAKRDRGSFEPEDLIHAHVLGMDTLALGTALAGVVIEEGLLDSAVSERYRSWTTPLAKAALTDVKNPSAESMAKIAELGLVQSANVHMGMSAHHELKRSIVLRALPKALKLLGI